MTEAAPPPRTFYRLVMSDPATRDDFLSYEALGLVPEDATDEQRRICKGVSVNATRTQALKRRRLPALRRYLYTAELVVPEGSNITYERSGSQPGHHTLYGDPDDLLACVTACKHVDEVD